MDTGATVLGQLRIGDVGIRHVEVALVTPTLAPRIPGGEGETVKSSKSMVEIHRNSPMIRSALPVLLNQPPPGTRA